jgi:hypothetical protein
MREDIIDELITKAVSDPSYAPEKALLAYQFTLKTLAILSVGGGKVMLFLTAALSSNRAGIIGEQ